MFHIVRNILNLKVGSLRNWHVRVKFLCVLFASIFIYCYLSKPVNKSDDWYRYYGKFLDTLNNSECKIPEYDIYDPQILKFITKPPHPLNCGNVQPYMTYLDREGYLHINKTEIDADKYNVGVKCFYQNVSLNKDDDYVVEYGEKKEIEFPMKVQWPTIKVECFDGITKMYVMVHTHIQDMSAARVEKNKDIPPHRPSLLIFGIDSMSRGNFIRTLPMTYNFLVQQKGMTVFNGLNKIADNTFPNMLALLAGFAAYKRGLNVPLWTPQLNSTIKGYDEMPIVWKSLKEQGYITMYCEEYLDTIFSYVDYGFRKDPVDYYYRAPYVALKQTLSNINLNNLKFWDRSRRRYCLGNEPSYKYMLNYTEEFLTEMAHLRYFALSFFVELSHEYLTDVANMDRDLYMFFTTMFSKGYFDNTVLLVMGDHGHRFDDIRSTYIGRLEERMPFLGIHLPHTMRKKYPHLQKSLNTHTNRLLSWYDIHETLMDIVEDDLGVIQNKPRPQAIGKSIFREFNEVRTCSEIGILAEYCVCDREADIPVQSKKATESAEVAIQHINNMLSESSDYLRKDEIRVCAHLEVLNITLASASMRSYSVGTFSFLIRIIFYAWPSMGKFEAAVEYKPGTKPSVLGDINRINKYGDQPSCISHNILRLYCFCTTMDSSTPKGMKN